MRGSTSVAVSGGGGDVYRAPFTAVQWQELEHQALIYKYLVAGVPVPSDLVVPIRRSLEALSARFFNHPTLGYCSYYGKKFDPEPGRCRRTDGKKWRCSKDAYQESKYCERHMHRGRNRSRKPVESQSNSQSLSTATSPITTVNSSGSNKGSYQNVSTTSFSNQSLYPITNSESFDFGSNVSKLQADTTPYMINNKDYRYAHDVADQTYASGVSGNVRGLGVDSNIDNTWRLMPTQVSESSVLKPRDGSYLQENSLQLNMVNAFEPMIDTTSMSKERQQHCFFGNEIGSPNHVKHERPFFDEWSKAKEPWSELDATTQLSISMAPEFNGRNTCSPNDA